MTRFRDCTQCPFKQASRPIGASPKPRPHPPALEKDQGSTRLLGHFPIFLILISHDAVFAKTEILFISEHAVKSGAGNYKVAVLLLAAGPQ